MDEPTVQHPSYCAGVAWGMERVDLRFPTHGAAECRATGRGVEVHACRRRAGHEEDGTAHVCYCGLTWTPDAPEVGADEKMAVAGPPSPDRSPEGTSLGEVAMVGEQLWREVHQRFYVGRQSKLAISLELGLDRKTVRRLVQQETWRPYDRAPQAVTLLTPFVAFLTERAPQVQYSARILVQELRQRQYAGSYETVKRFVQPLRTAAVAAAGTQTRFETPPGQQSQIDWGQAQVAFRRGRARAVHFFVLTLGYSRRSFYAAYLGETLGQFLDAHERAFEHFGGHTREHLYDRPRTVTHPAGAGHPRRWNVTFKAFADYWSFEPRLCRAYRPRTKGKVESGVRYLKGNFLPGRAFVDDRDLAEQLAQWQAEIADVRVHGTTHERPCDRFQREQPFLLPTRGHRGFALEARQPRLVAEDYLVSFESNRYSVPFTLVGHAVAVQRQGGQLLIFHRERLVAEHALLAGKYQTAIRPDHGPGPIARNARRVHSTGPASAAPSARPPFPEVETRDPALYEALCADRVPA